MPNRGHRTQRHELIVGPRDIDVFQLLRVQAINALDLRDDLVTPAGDVEAIDVIATDARGHVGADLLHVEPKRRHFLVIENDLGLRLVDFRVDVRKSENSGLHRFLLNLLGKL